MNIIKKSSLLVIGASSLAMTACDNEEGNTQDKVTQIQQKTAVRKSIPVKLAEVSQMTEAQPIVTSGVLAAKSEIKLSFKIGGIIQQMYAQEGGYVQRGQLLAKLEQTEIQAQVSKAKSALAKANRDLKRVENLYQDTVATLEQLQNVTTAKEVAESDIRIARFNQKYAMIYAPVSGKILKKFTESNELVGPGNPVYTLASSEQAQVIRVGLADRDIVKIKLGDKAKVKFDAYPGEVFEAVVSEIAESADPRTTTFEVEIQMVNPKKPLKKGFIGKVNIIPSQGTKGYKIPMGALVEADKKRAFIYIPDAQHQKALKVAVNTSKIGKDYLVVNFPEGQKPAREVIVDGASYLEDQSRIKVVQSKKVIAKR
ncbi:hypothetical protein BKI52_36240 [marine bacterium AO1-C]|nr:hypothetical protein BKI52_36240 [marine bacterium AO1-C]